MEVTKEDIEKMKQADLMESMMEEFADTFPNLKKVIFDERDMFLAGSIKRAAANFPTIVAVVGLGHVNGIVKHLNTDVDCDELMTIHRPPWWRKWVILSALGCSIVGVILIRKNAH
jgi:pheromone shutdown protein TraB